MIRIYKNEFNKVIVNDNDFFIEIVGNKYTLKCAQFITQVLYIIRSILAPKLVKKSHKST